MITLQSYRVVIDAFLGKARKLTTDHYHQIRNDCNARFKTLYNNSGTVCFLRMLMLVAFIVIVTCNLNIACFKYFKGRNFRDFAIFGKIRESLFPRNICYL